MSDRIYCGRCHKEIKENIFLIEVGFGNVHAKCAVEEVIQKPITVIEAERRKREFLDKWK